MPTNPQQPASEILSTDANSQLNNTKPISKRPRGFAAMDPAQHRLIASQGGKASHASGRGHQFTPEEASVAGRKGGKVLGKRREPDDTPSAND